MIQRTHLALAAALLASPLAAQRWMDTVFVVRHDPTLVRLHESMLEALLGPDSRKELLEGVEGIEDHRHAFGISIEASPSGEQPEGVFVGTLRVTYPDGPPNESARRVTDATLDWLRDELGRRLHEKPRETWTRELESVRAELAAVQEALSSEERASDRLAEAERAAREAKELDARSRAQRAVVESLQRELAEARERAHATENQRSSHAEEFDQRRLEVERLREALRAEQEGGQTDNVRRYRQQLEEVLRALSHQEQNHERMTRDQVMVEARLEKIASALENARIELVRLQTTERVIEESAKVMTGEVEDRRIFEGRRAKPDAQDRRRLERELARLERRSEHLIERLAALRPVELEVWR